VVGQCSVRDLAQVAAVQLAPMGASTAGSLLQPAPMAENPTGPSRSAKPPANPPSTMPGALTASAWNISATKKTESRSGSAGGTQGASTSAPPTAVYLLAAATLGGFVVLSNSAPIGVPETIALTFLDLATPSGQPRLDYFP